MTRVLHPNTPGLIDFSKIYTPHPKQYQFHFTKAKYRLFGGGMGGGKTYAALFEAILNCMMYPGNRGIVIRATRPRLKANTVPSFLKLCPPEALMPGPAGWNKSDLVATFRNGSRLEFKQADITKDPELNILRGLEAAFFVIEEANEVHEKVFQTLSTRMRWTLPNGKIPPLFMILTCNPSPGWVKQRFVDQQLPKHAFISSLMKDNPFLPRDYMSDNRQILSVSDAARFIDGDWNIADDPNQLFKYEWIRLAMERPDLPFDGTRSLGVDVARFGDDSCCMAPMTGPNFQPLIITPGMVRTTKYAKQVGTYMKAHRIPASRTAVDTVGLGAGVADNLYETGLSTIEFNGGESPYYATGAYEFTNLRAQGFWALRNALESESISLPSEDPDNMLTQELLAIRYKMSSTDRMITLENKDVLKSRLGWSPDRADAVMMGNAVHAGLAEASRVEIAATLI